MPSSTLEGTRHNKVFTFKMVERNLHSLPLLFIFLQPIQDPNTIKIYYGTRPKAEDIYAYTRGEKKNNGTAN